MKTFRNSLLILALGAMTMGAYAQSTATGPVGPPTDKHRPRVDQVNDRRENQQDRIGQGVTNGSLTPGETARLERGERKLNRNERRDLHKNNNHLSKTEQARLNHEENNLSKRVYRDKHNRARQ